MFFKTKVKNRNETGLNGRQTEPAGAVTELTMPNKKAMILVLGSTWVPHCITSFLTINIK